VDDVSRDLRNKRKILNSRDIGDLMTISVRRPVAILAILIEYKLRKNDHKQSWRELSFEYLLKRMYEEYVELNDSMTGGGEPLDSAFECVDVAAFSAMVIDNLIEFDGLDVSGLIESIQSVE
jgi:hypothetical protein